MALWGRDDPEHVSGDCVDELHSSSTLQTTTKKESGCDFVQCKLWDFKGGIPTRRVERILEIDMILHYKM